jgi:hypothetical protein
MSLATSFRVTEDGLRATCIQPDGSEIALDPQDLRTDGVPPAAARYLTITLDLSKFEPTCFSEYASNLGYRSDGDFNHQTWAAVVGKQRFVIPALVLLRGLFCSCPTIWPTLFAPSSSNSCFLEALEVMLAEPSELKMALPVLSWIHCHPSAKAMWASIPAFAANAKIGLQLPAADFHVVAYGHFLGRNLYVRHIQILSIRAKEAPYAFAPHSRRTILVDTQKKIFPDGMSEDLPLRAAPDGRLELSDEEWSVISSMLEGPNYKKLQRDLSRRFLNALIRRAVLGMSLNAVATSEGVKTTTLQQALVRWRRDGRWEQIVRYLDDVRHADNQI